MIYTYMNGQCLNHDPYPVYLGVTLYRTVSYREHLSHSVAAKLKSRNNLMRNSLVLHGVPVQAPFAHQPWLHATQSQNTAVHYGLDAATQISSIVDTQLHSSMRLISGCLQPTQLSWLPVLSNVTPPSLRRKSATDSMLQIIEACPNWPVFAGVFEHPRLASRHSLWSDCRHS